MPNTTGSRPVLHQVLLHPQGTHQFHKRASYTSAAASDNWTGLLDTWSDSGRGCIYVPRGEFQCIRCSVSLREGGTFLTRAGDLVLVKKMFFKQDPVRADNTPRPSLLAHLNSSILGAAKPAQRGTQRDPAKRGVPRLQRGPNNGSGSSQAERAADKASFKRKWGTRGGFWLDSSRNSQSSKALAQAPKGGHGVPVTGDLRTRWTNTCQDQAGFSWSCLSAGVWTR